MIRNLISCFFKNDTILELDLLKYVKGMNYSYRVEEKLNKLLLYAMVFKVSDRLFNFQTLLKAP